MAIRHSHLYNRIPAYECRICGLGARFWSEAFWFPFVVRVGQSPLSKLRLYVGKLFLGKQKRLNASTEIYCLTAI